jgi:hypothetical protein
MDEEQLKLPPAKSLVNEIALLHDQIMDLVEAQREANRKLDALLTARQPEVL